MRVFKTEGVIIRRRNVGEADRLLTVFTKLYGKIRIVAKGIRRIPSRRSAHVELLNIASLSLYQLKGYPILTEASAIETFSGLKNDLQKTGFAYHICELIDSLCAEGQEHPSVYRLLQQVLRRLEIEHDIHGIVYKFEVELLSQLGFWRDLRDVSSSFDTHSFIEQILERRLKSHQIFRNF